MGAVKIETVGADRAAEFAALHERCFEKAWSVADFSALLAQPETRGFLARNGGPAVGLALVCATAGEADILTIGADPSHRRAGLGLALLDACETAARAAGADRVFLDVSAANEAALKLYVKAGYVRAGLRPRYYGDGSDALLFEKPLA